MERNRGDQLRRLQTIQERDAVDREVVTVTELSGSLDQSVQDLFAHLVQLDEVGLVRLTLGTDITYVVVLTAEGHRFLQVHEDGTYAT